MSAELERLASSCILPGFEGPVVPDWVRRRLAEGLGGVVLYAWNVESRDQLRALTDDLRSERPDLLIAIDEEGGDVTRLEAATGSSYPGNGALGVVDDVELTERVAAAIGAELAEVGVNLDFAPVADVNTNPQNPVIGIRSFGSDGPLVASHVAAFVRGLQSSGVAACAKHFPGHGDTAVDSHLALPLVDELDEAALVPFRAAIEEGVQSIMTAHIVVRSTGETPATMNPRDPGRPASRGAWIHGARRDRRARDEGNQRRRGRRGGCSARDRRPVRTRCASVMTSSTSPSWQSDELSSTPFARGESPRSASSTRRRVSGGSRRGRPSGIKRRPPIVEPA